MGRNERHRTGTHLSFLWSGNSKPEEIMFIINIYQQARQYLIIKVFSDLWNPALCMVTVTLSVTQCVLNRS